MQRDLFGPRGVALFSVCGKYRYTLSRDLGEPSKRVAFCMLNPSTATEDVDDPTIRRCIRFAQSWGFGWLDVVNLYAWRATDPSALRKTSDPVGEHNDAYIVRIAAGAQRVVCAWGVNVLGGRDQAVLELLESTAPRPEVVALALTKAGHPKHPLYVPKDIEPVPFARRSAS